MEPSVTVKPRSSSATHVQWIGMSQVWRLLLQFLTVVVLSRILAVSDFGLMAMASVVIMFAELFSGMGMTAALIQKDRLTESFTATVFWSNLAFGLIIGFIVMGSSPLVAAVFHEPRLVGILTLLAMVFPVAALGSTHLALLEREVRFRNVAMAEIFAASLGVLTALALAWKGAGVYALVGQSLMTCFLLTVQYWLFSRWQPIFHWRRDELRGVWQFGGNLVGFNVVNYFARNSDNILIGKFLGSTELGLYNLAFRLMYLPTQTLVYAINRVLFPIYSEKIRTGKKVSKYFLKIVALVALIVAPMSFGLWSVREPLVAALLGPQWAHSTAVLAWLAPAGLLQALLYTTGSIFMSAGRTDILLKLAVVNTAIIVAAFALGVQFGIVAVAIAYLCAYIIIFAIGFYVVIEFICISIMSFLNSIWAPFVCASIMAGVVSITNYQLGMKFSAIGRLLILIPLGAAIYFTLIALVAKGLLIELRGILNYRTVDK
jgi:PST family polysaccharide transporter